MKNTAKLIVLAAIIFTVDYAKADSYILDVPFISQVPPGDWNHTRNCGPTSALMLAGYYLNFIPGVDDIKAIDDWLYDQQIIYAQAGVDQYNGNYTNLNDLKYLISDYFNLGPSEKVYPNDSKEEYVKEQIRRGNPIIVAVRLNMKAGGAGHFMVVIGYDDDGVIVHDPGHSASNGGLANHYSYDQFIASWASWDYASLHVKRFVSWHPNGTLVKDHYNPDVYIILDGAKHAILNWEVFLAHDFDANKIIEVSQQELDCYADSWMVDWKPYRQVFGTGDGYYLLEKLDENDQGCAIYDFASSFSAESWGNYVPDIEILSDQEADEIFNT